MKLLLRLTDRIRHSIRLRRWTEAHAWGRRGEDLAHRYLQSKGYTVVARNFRIRTLPVELDIVARQGNAVVFVEVKTRATDEFGTPDRAVDADKQDQIIRAAAGYLRIAELPWDRTRFDIVSVTFAGHVKIEHFQDAFRRDGRI